MRSCFPVPAQDRGVAEMYARGQIGIIFEIQQVGSGMRSAAADTEYRTSCTDAVEARRVRLMVFGVQGLT